MPDRNNQSFLIFAVYCNSNCAITTAHAEVILPGMSAFLAVVVLFVFHLARHGGEAPCGASFGVKCAAGFLAQLLAGDEFGHGGHFLSTNRI